MSSVAYEVSVITQKRITRLIFNSNKMSINSIGRHLCKFWQNWREPSLCLLVGNGGDPAYLPMNAGLSSSSALVVASAMAFMRATKTYVEPVSITTHYLRVVVATLIN